MSLVLLHKLLVDGRIWMSWVLLHFRNSLLYPTTFPVGGAVWTCLLLTRHILHHSGQTTSIKRVDWWALFVNLGTGQRSLTRFFATFNMAPRDIAIDSISLTPLLHMVWLCGLLCASALFSSETYSRTLKYAWTLETQGVVQHSKNLISPLK